MLIVLMPFAALPQGDLCLSPARLESFLAQESTRDLQAFLAEMEATPAESALCRRTEGRLCFRRSGLYALWSNNAASVWVGPLIGGEEEARFMADRLEALTERARALTRGGDYAGAAAGQVILRDGECFATGGVAGRADPQLLYAIGREAVRLKAAEDELEILLTQVFRTGSGATEELLAEINSLATSEIGAAFGAEPGRSAAETLPLGRAADGLLHAISNLAVREDGRGKIGAGRSGSTREAALGVGFARWIARATEIGLAATDIGLSEWPMVERLALLGYMRAPEVFEEVAAWSSPQPPPDDVREPAAYFQAIAAHYRALDALAGFADAWADDGPLHNTAQAVTAFARTLPERTRERLETAASGTLFALSEEADSQDLPLPTDLQRLALAGMRQSAIAERITNAVSELGRAGLALAVAKLARETGIGPDPAVLAGHLATAAHSEVAATILQSTLKEAFAADSATTRHIEALATGRFDRFSTGLLETALAVKLAESASGDPGDGSFDPAAAGAIAEALTAGEPYAALRAGLEPAVTALDASWQRAMSDLLDGRTGAAASRIVRLSLAEAGLTAREVDAVLAGQAESMLDRKLAEAAELSSEQLAALVAGEAPDYVRRRAAAAFARADANTGAEEVDTALQEEPQEILEVQRQAIEADLLGALLSAGADVPDSLADLGGPAIRREMAASILATQLGGPAVTRPAITALIRDDRAGAIEAALSPLMSGIPGGAALLAGQPGPYREGVAVALKEAVGAALGDAAAERLLDETALERLRNGDVKAMGRSYAERIFVLAGLTAQTQARLLAGEEEAAWRHEGRARAAGTFGRIPASHRITHALWRARAAIDLSRLALARERMIHGVVLPGEGGGETDERELN